MSQLLHNRKVLERRRKDLRNTATDTEKILWCQLKSSKLGWKFRRQHSVGSYVLDFYCPARRLAIEVDGFQHGEGEQLEYDEIRTRLLESVGIRVLRFWNGDVRENLRNVILKIKEALEEKTHNS